MSNLYHTSASTPVDSIWLSINHLSNDAKVELIKRLSESILKSDSAYDAIKRDKFLNLAGSWNDDPKSVEMDNAALGLRNSRVTRDFSFD